MPLEGQWQRTQTPLRGLNGRERGVAITVIAVTVVALAAILLATAGNSRPGPGPGCFRATVAGRTGGEPVSACDGEAVALCKRASRLEGPWADSVTAACVDAAIRF